MTLFLLPFISYKIQIAWGPVAVRYLSRTISLIKQTQVYAYIPIKRCKNLHRIQMKTLTNQSESTAITGTSPLLNAQGLFVRINARYNQRGYN